MFREQLTKFVLEFGNTRAMNNSSIIPMIFWGVVISNIPCAAEPPKPKTPKIERVFVPEPLKIRKKRLAATLRKS